ncbi:amidohydrolase family protein [Gelidibacter japonicus]|uniref:metal-dependent hydrolase family protein n=1 Tax=Gelidibacter japonicus TaxID=1962232 RepID=UPI002AFDF84A|nr:amidohydrolase family protein [Gelidibacter japonicus]
MKNRLYFIFFLITFSVTSQKKDLPIILIKNVEIFDGINQKTINGNILIEGNKISKISKSNISSTSKNVLVIDGEGKFVMPGLIDAHTHISMEGIPIGSAMVDWGTVNIISTQAAKHRLLHGFTTLRNMGGNAIPLAKQIDKGTVPGPRIYPSGAFISQSGGHGDFDDITAVPRTSDNLSYSERQGISAIADGADEVLKRTREQLRQGATQIKLMAGGGIGSSYDPIDVTQYSLKEFEAAVLAAENFGTYVGVHAYTPQAIQIAIEAGVRTIEHGHLLDEETAKIMAEKGVWLSIQPFMIEEQNDYPIDSPSREKRDYVYGHTDEVYKIAKKYKVKTAWGTDLTGKQKIDSRNDLTRLVGLKKWFSPYEALKMVTSTNAEMLRLSGPRNPYQQGKLGELTEGAYADLIIVKGNPLRDFDLLNNPEDNLLLIMKDGKVYKNLLNDIKFDTTL